MTARDIVEMPNPYVRDPLVEMPNPHEMFPVDETLYDKIRALYPWAERLGIMDIVADAILDDKSPEEILATIRQTPEWKNQFPSFYAEDGSKRFRSEAEYMQHVEDLRDVMKEYGVYDVTVEAPQNYIGLIENGIDPNEFRQRFDTYRALEAGTQELRDAFYIYAGLEVSVDDMYSAVVDPSFQSNLVETYDRAVTRTPPDYETYITRATERALEHLADGVGSAADAGILPASSLKEFINVDPEAARVWMDVLYTAGGEAMSFAELNKSFQYAMLASAASEKGLALPDKERLNAFVQAGVSRASADRAYSTFAQQRFGLAGMSKRAGLQNIDQTLFEEASLLGDARAQAALGKAFDRERSLGKQSGGFSSSLEGTRVAQIGR